MFHILQRLRAHSFHSCRLQNCTSPCCKNSKRKFVFLHGWQTWTAYVSCKSMHGNSTQPYIFKYVLHLTWVHRHSIVTCEKCNISDTKIYGIRYYMQWKITTLQVHQQLHRNIQAVYDRLECASIERQPVGVVRAVYWWCIQDIFRMYSLAKSYRANLSCVVRQCDSERAPLSLTKGIRSTFQNSP